MKFAYVHHKAKIFESINHNYISPVRWIVKKCGWYSSRDFYLCATIRNSPVTAVIVSETIWSYGDDHVVARKSSSGRSIDGE